MPRPPTVAVVGDVALARRLALAGLAPAVGEPAAAVVVGGPVGERAAVAGRAVARGAHAFVLWPPGVSAAELDALGSRAEEAGVEVGVARPLETAALLAGRPVGWTARLVTLSAVAAPGGPLARAGWPALLAGALDLAAALAGSHAAARLDAEAERDGAALRAVALAVRLRNGAFAQVALRRSPQADRDEVALYASRPGSRVEARSFRGPLCLDGAPTGPTASVAAGAAAEAGAFARAVSAGRAPAYPLGDALATLRLVEQAQERLR
jgi:predicted dehydrogenase